MRAVDAIVSRVNSQWKYVDRKIYHRAQTRFRGHAGYDVASRRRLPGNPSRAPFTRVPFHETRLETAKPRTAVRSLKARSQPYVCQRTQCRLFQRVVERARTRARGDSRVSASLTCKHARTVTRRLVGAVHSMTVLAVIVIRVWKVRTPRKKRKKK